MIKTAGIHHLLVTDEDKLVGIISDRDLHKPKCMTARDMMTSNPLTIQTDSEINDAISLMITNRFSAVPVMDGEKLVGLISTSDIAVTLQCLTSLLSSLFSPIAGKIEPETDASVSAVA